MARPRRQAAARRRQPNLQESAQKDQIGVVPKGETSPTTEMQPQATVAGRGSPAFSLCSSFIEQLAGTLSEFPFYPVRSALFLHGSTRAAMRILSAVVLNHIRRLLAPWLLQFFWHHALEDMKLSRSSPHYYLSTSASSLDWAPFVAWNLLWLYALPAAGKMLREATLRDREGDGWAILYVFFGLSLVESGYVQACWVGAQLHAYGVLFWRASRENGEAEGAFLEKFMEEQSTRVMAQLGLLIEILVHGAAPALRRASRMGAWAVFVLGAMVAGGTMYLVRYSNKYFLLLEMSDVLVTFGWGLLGMVFVGMESLRGDAKVLVDKEQNNATFCDHEYEEDEDEVDEEQQEE